MTEGTMSKRRGVFGSSLRSIVALLSCTALLLFICSSHIYLADSSAVGSNESPNSLRDATPPTEDKESDGNSGAFRGVDETANCGDVEEMKGIEGAKGESDTTGKKRCLDGAGNIITSIVGSLLPPILTMPINLTKPLKTIIQEIAIDPPIHRFMEEKNEAPGFKDANFYGLIGAGGQTKHLVRMNFDTTHAISWIPSMDCASCPSIHRVYGGAAPHQGGTTSITVQMEGDTGAVMGYKSTDTFVIGEKLVQGINFLEVHSVSSRLHKSYEGVEYNGAFSLSPIHQNNAPIQPLPFYVTGSGEQKPLVTSIFVSHNGSEGKVIFGEVMKGLYVGTMTYLPLLRSDKWEVQVKFISDLIGDADMSNKDSEEHVKMATFDTASSMIVGPADVVKSIATRMKATEVAGQKGVYALKCSDVKDLKPIYFKFMVGEALPLKPSQYVMEYHGVCYLGFVGRSDGSSHWNLGLLFMQAYYTVLDNFHYMVGLAKSVQENNAEEYY